MSKRNEKSVSAIKKPSNFTCRLCAKPFGKEVIYSNGRLFHTKCAICFNCKKPFADRKFYLKGSAMFCSKCYRYMYLPRCSGCMCPIKEMNKCIKAMEVKWHQKCFRCCICRDILNKYTVVNNHPVCLDCYASDPDIIDRDFYMSNDDRNVTVARPCMSDDDVDLPYNETSESSSSTTTTESDSNHRKRDKFEDLEFL